MNKSGNGKYKVGYGKPPPEHQWKKGGPSPNAKGRPRKRQPSSFAELIDAVFREKVPMVRRGRKSLRPVREGIIRKLVMGVADGDRGSFTILNGMRKWGPLGDDSADVIDEFLKQFGIAFTLKLEEDDPTPSACLYRLDDPSRVKGMPFSPFGDVIEPDEPQ